MALVEQTLHCQLNFFQRINHQNNAKDISKISNVKGMNDRQEIQKQKKNDLKNNACVCKNVCSIY